MARAQLGGHHAFGVASFDPRGRRLRGFLGMAALACGKRVQHETATEHERGFITGSPRGSKACYSANMAWIAGMLVLAGALAGCGHGSSGAPPPARHDAGVAPRDAAPLELQAQPLGLPDFAAFGWRKRSGHTAYRAARRAEARGD